MNELHSNQFYRHRGPVTATLGVPGSQWILTSGYDSAVAMFHRTNHEVKLLGYHQHLANSLAVSCEGRLAASCSSDYNICIWDLEETRLRYCLRGHEDDVEAFTFVDEALGISVSRDRSVRIWDLDSGSCKQILHGHDKDVLSVAYADGKVFSCGDDMTLRCWSLQSGENLNTWGPFDTETDTCAVDIERKRLVLGCDDGRIRIFSMENGELLKAINAHNVGIKKVAVCEHNGDILSAAYDQKILIWDGQTLQTRLTLENHPGKWERSFSWSPCGQFVYSGTFDGSVLCWESESGRLLNELGQEGSIPGNPCLNEIDVDSTGQLTAVSDDGIIRFWAHKDQSLSINSIVPEQRILMNAVAFDSGNSRIYCGDHHNTLHQLTYASDGLNYQRATAINEGPINSVKVAKTNDCHGDYQAHAFVGCYSGTVCVVAPDGRLRHQFRLHDNAVKSIVLHPQQAVGVSCSADGILVVWDFDGNLLHELQAHDAIINDVGISPGGNEVVSVSRDFSLKRYDINRNRLISTITLPAKSPKSVCYFDEKTILIGNYWGQIGKLSLPDETLSWHQLASNGISSLTSDQHRVYAASYDGSIRSIDPHSMHQVALCELMQQKIPA